jgi:hypothetical protein
VLSEVTGRLSNRECALSCLQINNGCTRFILYRVCGCVVYGVNSEVKHELVVNNNNGPSGVHNSNEGQSPPNSQLPTWLVVCHVCPHC